MIHSYSIKHRILPSEPTYRSHIFVSCFLHNRIYVDLFLVVQFPIIQGVTSRGGASVAMFLSNPSQKQPLQMASYSRSFVYLAANCHKHTSRLLGKRLFLALLSRWLQFVTEVFGTSEKSIIIERKQINNGSTLIASEFIIALNYLLYWKAQSIYTRGKITLFCEYYVTINIL